MQQIIFFLIRNKNFLLFIALFSISIFLTIQTHSYHKNKFVNSSNAITGGIYSIKSSITDYFNLKEENKILINENTRIRKQLESFKSKVVYQNIDTSSILSKYYFVSAKVINNSFSKTKNKLTINKGKRDSIQLDMGVITSKGIVGIIDNLSNKYATIQSILNTNSQINAKLKNAKHFGSLVWNAEDPNVIQLIDIPRLAPVKTGDTIVTGGRSTIFPEGILIGVVIDFELTEDENSQNLNIQLFNDMTNLEHVYIIDNIDTQEIINLEKGLENVE
ncbi:MAG: rod shape-determining protein MreC [Flavobacteriaceae bacterium]|jgi:rod shape-determining protein MreC|nr:rod shape-determining protein MreC [Flavobacteriaceae bacterium]